MSILNDIIAAAATAKKNITAQLDVINTQVADIIPPPAQTSMSEEQLWQQNWKKRYDAELAKKPQNQNQIQLLIETKAMHDYPGGPAAYHAKYTGDAVKKSYLDSIQAGIDATAKAANPLNWLEWMKTNWPWVAGLVLIGAAIIAFASGFGRGAGSK